MTKAVCIVLFTLWGGFFSLRAELPWKWKFDEKTDPPRIEVQLGLNAPTTVTGIDATADGQKLPVQFVPFGEGEGDVSAVLFLIDTSDPKRARSIEAAKALALRLIDIGDARTEFAIYAFDANLVPVAELGTPRDEMAARLKPVKARGLATELYRNTIEAIRVLETRKTWRRSLVLLSDGKAEDTTFTLEQVVEAAKKAGVAIDGVGYAETAQATVHLQSLRRLSAETNGMFVEADQGTRAVADGYVNDFFPRLHSGGFAVVNLADHKLAAKIELEIRTPIWPAAKVSYVLTTLAPAAMPAPVQDDKKAAEVAAKVAEMAKKMEEVARQVEQVPAKVEEAAKAKMAEEIATAAALAAKANEAAEQEAKAARKKKRAFMVAGFAALLLAGGGAFLFARRATPAAVEAAPVFARLQVLDGDGTEHLMRTTALRVGRGKDNDLTLRNDSVSRHHAEISRTRDGAFTITELNSGNGVLVNGAAVEKSTLKNEDIIELGEVRIRFLVAPETANHPSS